MTAARRAVRGGAIAGALALLAACGTPVPAPVIERKAPVPAKVAAAPSGAPARAASGAGFHQVKKGETLQSIALDYGQDRKDLMAWNNLDNPNVIRVGQTLRVAPPDGAVVIKPVSTQAPQEIRATESSASAPAPAADGLRREPRGGKQPYSQQAWSSMNGQDAKSMSAASPEPAAETPLPENVDWAWPAAGKVVAPFSEGSNKGVAISGKVGDPVRAAGAGKVLYAGEDLRGYGKLVVLKHNASFLSVYAHNNQILVKEGQMVAKGEKIAELGKSDSDLPKLHFEIRRQGKPVDPVKFLPPR